jgi:DNA-binding transcriptional LysR family regulator
VHAVELSLGLESKLSIGVVADIDRRRLLAAIKVIAERHPLLDIEVLTAPQDDVLAMLHSGRVSVCLAFAGLSMNVLERFQFVGSERMIATLAADSPLLQGRICFSKTWYMCGRSSSPVATCRSAKPGRWWPNRTGAPTPWRRLEMVEAGLGWGNFPLSVVQPWLDSGRLKRLNFRNIENGLVLPVHAVWLKSQPLQNASALVELLSH